jgi:hypothetical protein
VKAIIIEEGRFGEVCDLMRSQMEAAQIMVHKSAATPDEKNLINAQIRAINSEFIRWAQSHGASCVRG